MTSTTCTKIPEPDVDSLLLYGIDDERAFWSTRAGQALTDSAMAEYGKWCDAVMSAVGVTDDNPGVHGGIWQIALTDQLTVLAEVQWVADNEVRAPNGDINWISEWVEVDGPLPTVVQPGFDWRHQGTPIPTPDTGTYLAITDETIDAGGRYPAAVGDGLDEYADWLLAVHLNTGRVCEFGFTDQGEAIAAYRDDDETLRWVSMPGPFPKIVQRWFDIALDFG